MVRLQTHAMLPVPRANPFFNRSGHPMERFTLYPTERAGGISTERREKVVPVLEIDAEIGVPQWLFGYSRYAFLSNRRAACVYDKNGMEHLAIIDLHSNQREILPVPYTVFGSITSDGDDTLFVAAASPTKAAEVAALEVRGAKVRVLKRSLNVEIDPDYFSQPQPIEFPTSGGLKAYALFYPPKNKEFVAPETERPPLLVISHGGPTSATTSALRLAVQYWTTRGIAVVDVNYGGSSGYGRSYRERLNGQWGIVDVEDCINAARYLEKRGDIDGKRMAIRGGSAGGYTTLCALVFHNVFAAGASYYGVADLETLARDTHKFESRYEDGLVGPYPAAAELYRQRSPVHFADQLSCPVILLQGLEDKVVPPSQAENIRRSIEAEFYFYSRIFGFTVSDQIQPVEIENL